MLHKKPGKNISETAIDAIVDEIAKQYGKQACIDIGAGPDDNNYLRQQNLIQTLDFREEFSPDFLCKVQDLFVPDYPISSDNIASKIHKNHYMLIKLHHVIEHIEWIYQEFLFRWLMEILAPGGIIYIATPNLEYVLGVYYTNIRKQRKGKNVKFPADDHPYLNMSISSDMQRWVNSKLFSGCSPGDYHHTCYDRFWLEDMLTNSGFNHVSIFDGYKLKAIAYKPQMKQFDVGEAIKRATE